MEASRSRKIVRVASTLSLSIAALLLLVNGRAQSLTSVNLGKSPTKSAKNTKNELERLIQILLERGADKKVSNIMAPVLGLEKPSNVKQHDVTLKHDENNFDGRSCFIVFTDDEQKSPMCLFVKRARQTADSAESKYFKVSIAGKLENAIVWAGKKTAAGAVPGSGVKTEQDIESSEVKKEFDAEMAYWLKDWLKKEQKADAKKKVTSAASAKTATAL
jgi:hypothetical protein